MRLVFVFERFLELVEEPLEDGRIVLGEGLYFLDSVMVVLVTDSLSEHLPLNHFVHSLKLGADRIATAHPSNFSDDLLDILLVRVLLS